MREDAQLVSFIPEVRWLPGQVNFWISQQALFFSHGRFMEFLFLQGVRWERASRHSHRPSQATERDTCLSLARLGCLRHLVGNLLYCKGERSMSECRISDGSMAFYLHQYLVSSRGSEDVTDRSKKERENREHLRQC